MADGLPLVIRLMNHIRHASHTFFPHSLFPLVDPQAVKLSPNIYPGAGRGYPEILHQNLVSSTCWMGGILMYA